MKRFNKIAIFSLMAFGLFLLNSCTTTNSLSGRNNYSENTINDEEDFLVTKINYPTFEEFPKLSNRIKNTIDSDWKNFKILAKKNWESISSLNGSSSYAPFEYYVEYKVSGSGNIISVYLSTYRYAGGAHGETTITTLNYDTVDEEFKNISQVTDYSYEELSDLTKKELYNNLILKNKYEIDEREKEFISDLIESGTKPYAGNFELYTLNNRTLSIYFEQYTVAPYSYGVQVVNIPLYK